MRVGLIPKSTVQFAFYDAADRSWKGGCSGALFEEIRAEPRSFSYAKKRVFRPGH